MENERLALNANPVVAFLQKEPRDFTTEDIINFIRQNNIRMVNFMYPGGDGKLKTLNFVISDQAYLRTILTCGERVDGSSLFSFIEASSSDLYVLPRFSTAFVDPFSEIPTLCLLCSFFDKNGQPLASSPEQTLRRAAETFKQVTGMEYEAMGELEYYVIKPTENVYLAIDQRGYHESAPYAKTNDFRTRCMYYIAQTGGQIKYGHSEVGNFTNRFKGTGGLNQAFVGTAFKLGRHLSIGANGYFVFGNTKTETTLYFPDSLYMIGSRRSVDLMVKSFMFDYGLLYDTEINDDLHLSVGLTYTQSVKLSGVQTMFVRSIEEDADTEIEYTIDTVFNSTNRTKITMPQGFGGGIALQKGDRWGVGIDFNWTQWSKFAREGVTETLQNSWKVSVGGEFVPRHSSISNYFTRVTYRFGGFYEQGYLNLNGYNINKVGVTAGMSLPLPKTLSKVNLAIELGQYGTRMAGLIQERYIRADVGVSVFEHWFMKRKYR